MIYHVCVPDPDGFSKCRKWPCWPHWFWSLGPVFALLAKNGIMAVISVISSRWGWRNWCEVSHAVGSCPQIYRRAGERCSCGQLLHCERSESIKKTQYFLVLPGKSSKYIRDAVCTVLPTCLRLTRNMISAYIYIYILVVWRYCSWGWAWSIRSSLATTQTWWPEMQWNCTDQGNFLPWRTIRI